MCPTLKGSQKRINLENVTFSVLSLNQYKPMDHQEIQSPFHVSVGETRSMIMQYMNNLKLLSSSCYYRKTNSSHMGNELVDTEGRITYKMVNMVVGQNTNKYKLEYETDLLSCNPKYKLSEIFLIDFDDSKKNSQFISFYGCKSIKIDGKLKKFEGVLIFTTYELRKNEISLLERLNMTYNYLQTEVNISKQNLISLRIKEFHLKPDSCDDIQTNKKTFCKNKEHFFENIVNISVFWIVYMSSIIVRFLVYFMKS